MNALFRKELRQTRRFLLRDNVRFMGIVRGAVPLAKTINRWPACLFFLFAGISSATAEESVTLQAIEVQGSGQGDNLPPLQQTPLADKTGTKIEDLPQSVQIVPAVTVTEQGGTNLDAAIRNVSGVSQGGGDGFGFAERFLIRGLNPQIYSDGVSEGDQRNGIQQSINGVDHIEVIEGPGSALLGSGPPGGAINIVHLLPLPALAYGASTQFGTFNTTTTNLYATGPTTVPGLNFRVDGLVQHTDGFRALKKGDYEVRPVLSWDLNGHLISLSVDERHLTAVPDPAGIVYFNHMPADVSRETKYSTPFGSVTQDYIRTTLNDAWAAADFVTINNHLSYMHRTSSILRNGDGSVATDSPRPDVSYGINMTGSTIWIISWSRCGNSTPPILDIHCSPASRRAARLCLPIAPRPTCR